MTDHHHYMAKLSRSTLGSAFTNMSYYINKKVTLSFDEAVQKVTDLLKREGFGVLTEIDVDQVLRKKLDVEFDRYKILGACNPNFAHQALLHEDKVGTMLPCNVIVRQTSDNDVEIAAVDPIASMQAVNNPSLKEIALDVKEALSRVVNDI